MVTSLHLPKCKCLNKRTPGPNMLWLLADIDFQGIGRHESIATQSRGLPHVIEI
jgi:hypothetical protein